MIQHRHRQSADMSSTDPSRPLSCLFVITSMPVGGAETLLVNMMRRMNPERIRPEVVCLKEPGPLGEQIAEEFPVHSDLLSGKWDLRVLPRLIRLLHRRRADVVITVGAGDKMFWGRLAARLAGVSGIAAALHSTGWPDGVGRINRLLTPITNAFIAVAESHGDFLQGFERFPAEKVRIIRNGVDCSRFQPNPATRTSVRDELRIPRDAPLLGIVAALRSEKNHAMLLRAAARLRGTHPEAHWLVVGDGPERARIESLCRDLHLQDRVHLLGTRHDTPRLVAALDLFTLCSLNEASPVSVLESLACGVPVVATHVGSVGESVIEGRTGMLVPSQDVNAFTDAVGRLLSAPQQRALLGQQGRKLVLQSGSLQSMVDGYERLVIELYEAHTRRVAGAARRKRPRSNRLLLALNAVLSRRAGKGVKY